jgi:hypothetical protein
MTYLLAAAALLILLVWLPRQSRMFKRVQWRVASGVLSIGMLVGALAVGLRGEWIVSVFLILGALWMALSARWPRPQTAEPPAPSSGVSREQACAILGVETTATEAEIQAAYMRLMRLVHPDRGGASGLAAQLNIARDRLLGRKP